MAEVKRKVMNISPTQLCAGGPGGRGIHFAPREVKELTEPEFRGAEVQKLLAAKMLVDRTAAEERRVALSQPKA